MYPKSFAYHKAGSIEEAIELLSRYGDDAKVIAGGQSLIPMMKLRLVSPKHIVDINGIKEIEFIKEEGKSIVFGALARMSDVERSEIVRKKLPVVADCASRIADPLVRNMGTFGGNIAHSDPNNDMPSAMVVTDAKMVCRGKSGIRTINARDFFKDTFVTDMKEDEILESVTVPVFKNYSGTYVKLERLAGDYGIAGVAVWLSVEDGKFRDCRIALTGVGPTVIYAENASKSLTDKKVTRQSIKQASKIASDESKPSNDLRGTENFKRKAVSLLTEKALETSLERLGLRL